MCASVARLRGGIGHRLFKQAFLPGDRIPDLRSAGTIVPSGLSEGAEATKNTYNSQDANQNPPSPLRILAIRFLIPPDAVHPAG